MRHTKFATRIMSLTNSYHRTTGTAAVLTALIALGAIAPSAAAQVLAAGPLQRPTEISQPQITMFWASLEASLDNSTFGKQVVGPATPTFETSAPTATGTTSVTLRWTALPSTGQVKVNRTNLMGYVVLRATARPGVWDSVAFVTGPPAHVQAQVSPEANAIFRVGAYYSRVPIGVTDVGGNASIATLQPGNGQHWIDTTRAVRVITH